MPIEPVHYCAALPAASAGRLGIRVAVRGLR
jgi:hypothetical protein